MNIKLWALVTILYFGSATCLQVAEPTDNEIARQQLLGYLLENQTLMRQLVDDGKTSLDHYAHCVHIDAEGKQHYHPTEFDAFVSDHPLVRTQYTKDYTTGIQTIREMREALLHGTPCIVDEPERKIRWNITKELTSDPTHQAILQEVCEFYGISEPIAIFEGTQTGDGQEEETAYDGFICLSSNLRHAPYGYIREAIFHEIAHIRHHDRALEHILRTISPTEQTRALFNLGRRFVERRNDSLAFHATRCTQCMFEVSQYSTPPARTAVTTSMGYLSTTDICYMLDHFFHAEYLCKQHTALKQHKSFGSIDAQSFLTELAQLTSSPAPRKIRLALWKELCSSLQKSCGQLIQFQTSDPSSIELNVLIDKLPATIRQHIFFIDISGTSLFTLPTLSLDQVPNLEALYVNARQLRCMKSDAVQIILKKD